MGRYYRYNAVVTLRRSFIYFLTAFLFACAGGETRKDADVIEVKQTKEINSHIEIDSDIEADFKKAIAMMQQDNNAQAVAVLKTVIEREQRLPAPFVNIAIAYNKLGEIKAAEENLIRALKLDIGHAVANNEQIGRASCRERVLRLV